MSKGTPGPGDEDRRKNPHEHVLKTGQEGRDVRGSLTILGRMQVSNWTRAGLEHPKLFPYRIGARELRRLWDLRAADGADPASTWVP